LNTQLATTLEVPNTERGGSREYYQGGFIIYDEGMAANQHKPKSLEVLLKQPSPQTHVVNIAHLLNSIKRGPANPPAACDAFDGDGFTCSLFEKQREMGNKVIGLAINLFSTLRRKDDYLHNLGTRLGRPNVGLLQYLLENPGKGSE